MLEIVLVYELNEEYLQQLQAEIISAIGKRDMVTALTKTYDLARPLGWNWRACYEWLLLCWGEGTQYVEVSKLVGQVMVHLYEGADNEE